MQTSQLTTLSRLRNWLFFCQIATLFSTSFILAQSTTPVGTVQTVGKLGNIVAVELKVEGPSGQKTPLQVACLFEYTEGDIFISPPALPPTINGIVQLDAALHGMITELRKSGRFKGHALETLLLTISSGTIPAQKLLLIGLGDRASFTPELMERVSTVSFREAVRLGVDSFSQSSDLKDAGLDSPTAEVGRQVVTGFLHAYQTQRFLQQKNLSPRSPVLKITILTGPAFFETTKQGVTAALADLSTK